jgi:hypothetical protein
MSEPTTKPAGGSRPLPPIKQAAPPDPRLIAAISAATGEPEARVARWLGGLPTSPEVRELFRRELWRPLEPRPEALRTALWAPLGGQDGSQVVPGAENAPWGIVARKATT